MPSHAVEWSIKRVPVLWTCCGILIFLLTGFSYLKWQGFGEQGQINFAAVSYLLYQGYPLYVDAESSARYSLQHGPLTFMITGGVMKLFGANFVTAKVSGIVATGTALLLAWRWFSKVIGWQKGFLLLGLEIWMLFHWNYIYFIRPDSWLLLCTTISLYILMTKSSQMTVVLGLAIPLALAVNLKIHGAFYFLPIFALAYLHLPRRTLLIAGVLGSILAVVPYLLPGISFINYWVILTYSLGHGFSVGNFIPKLAILAILFLLPVGFLIWQGIPIKPLLRKYKKELLCFLLPLLVVSLIASKEGSGTNHLIPFLPIFFYFYLQLIVEYKQWQLLKGKKRSETSLQKPAALLFCLLLIIVTLSGFTTQKRLLSYIKANDYTLMIQDIERIQRENPGKHIEVGYGGERSHTLYRDVVAVPVFYGNPLYVEYVAMSDMKKAGAAITDATLKSLESGDITIWLIPHKDVPFSMDAQLFGERFQKTFFENYTLQESTPFFDLWVYKQAIDTAVSASDNGTLPKRKSE